MQKKISVECLWEQADKIIGDGSKPIVVFDTELCQHLKKLGLIDQITFLVFTGQISANEGSVGAQNYFIADPEQ